MTPDPRAESISTARGIAVAITLALVITPGALLCLSWARDAMAGDVLVDGRPIVGALLLGLGVWLAWRIDRNVRGAR